MIIQYDSDGAFRRVNCIEVRQQTNEFDTAVTIFHARRDMAVLEIQSCQYGTGGPTLGATMTFSNALLILFGIYPV